jgi:hypothetical protein
MAPSERLNSYCFSVMPVPDIVRKEGSRRGCVMVPVEGSGMRGVGGYRVFEGHEIYFY